MAAAQPVHQNGDRLPGTPPAALAIMNDKLVAIRQRDDMLDARLCEVRTFEEIAQERLHVGVAQKTQRIEDAPLGSWSE
jgi:hypothetical protein